MEDRAFSESLPGDDSDADVNRKLQINDIDNDLLTDPIKTRCLISEWRRSDYFYRSLNLAKWQSLFQTGFVHLTAIVLSASLAISAHAVTIPFISEGGAAVVQYEQGTIPQRLIKRQIYAGFGLGSSWLDPDTSEVAGVGTNDRVQSGFQINLGLDVNNWLSLELHAAELGNAGLSDGTQISYREFGGSALLYIGKARHRYQRRGLTGFGRLGVGALNTSASEGVRLEQDNNVHALFGVGIELMTRRGFGFRAEAITYEEDVSYGQLGLIYRFGRQREAVRAVLASYTPPSTLLSPSNGVAVPRADADNDGVPDLVDQCPAGNIGETVDYTGCALVSSRPELVYFSSNSLVLSNTARQKLDEVIATLIAHPDKSVLLTSHTDNRGSERDNLALSYDRATAVVSYITQRNVERSRITFNAYGETQPADRNDTKQGRQNNRRVELLFQR